MARKDFTGVSPETHKLAKILASARGLTIREYLTEVIKAEFEKMNRKTVWMQPKDSKN